ncbi:scavenger receptor class B member 1-like [Frankliniella occidentalis]|uniref:Scavenger receptor class B member 1-like n=1 Tax=Frankliniella occidentalis TaxID=133901 RepID=A0A9C6U5E4_FRAOC|nr:scavenger receptor class B member 1-like [Frankliniella occidentalis]
MVLKNLGSAESMTVGCLDWDRLADRHARVSRASRTSTTSPPCWQERVQDYHHYHRDAERSAARAENLRRNLPSFRVLRLLGTIGVALLALSYAVYLTNPIEIVINMKLSFMNGSFLFGLWRKPPVHIYVQVYLFNVTNPREFLKGQEKLRLEEVGPFVYREELENSDVTFNDNDTISYTTRRNVIYVPEKSVGDPREVTVLAPNIGLLGLASSLHNSSIFTNLAFATLVTYLDAQPFLRITVHDYMWGIDEPLVPLASKLFPKWISFPRLGILDRMFDEGHNVVTMNVNGDERADRPAADLQPGNASSVRRAFAIDSWNGSPGLRHWGFGKEDDPHSASSRCNTIRGATEGILFPPNMRHDMRFAVYRKAFCRTLPLQFVREGPTPDQVPAYWYTLRDDIFETADVNPDNDCYCRPRVAPCLPRGLSDLTPCYYDIPAAVSLPHFYKADESLLTKIDGLRPNRTLHGTTLAIQPRVGVPLIANIRVQTNLVVHKTKGNPRVKPFNNLTVPIFWVDLTVLGLPDNITALLDLMLVVGPVIQTTAIVLLGSSGALLLLAACAGVCCSAGMLHASSSPRAVPLQSAYKYSQVKIINAVKPRAEQLVSLSIGRDRDSDLSDFGKGRS